MWRPGNLASQCHGAGGDRYTNSNKEQMCPSFIFLFYPVLSGLDDACSHVFFIQSFQMLISSWDVLTDTPRNNVLSAIWESLSLVKLTHVIKNRKCWIGIYYFFHKFICFSYIVLHEASVQVCCPFSNGSFLMDCLFSYCLVLRVLYISWMCDLQIYSHSLWPSFSFLW